MKNVFKGVIAAAGLVLFGASHAAPINFNTIGTSFTTLYQQTYTDSLNPTGVLLKAEITYTLNSLGTNSAQFGISIKNTTAAGAVGTNRITGFGIETVTPNLNTVTTTSSIFTATFTEAMNPDPSLPGIGKLDFCTGSGSGSCSGGGGGGLGEGLTSLFNLNMTFASGVPPITFDNFAVRFQSVGKDDQGSSAFSGCVVGQSGCGGGTPPVLIPEPGSLALVSLALLGLGAMHRRRG